MRRAVGFLTVVPVGEVGPLDARDLRWFPSVGAALGAALGGIWWGAGEVWSPLLAAVVVVVADLALTGMLHLDGLLDSADGLLPPLSAERRLEVMADPGVGAFAVGVGFAVLSLRVAALASMEPSVVLLAALWSGSRTLMGTAAVKLRSARPTGLGASLGTKLPPPLHVALGFPAYVVATERDVTTAAIVLVGLVLGAGAVLALARRRIGGVTGDVLGAAGLVGETLGLVLAAARW